MAPVTLETNGALAVPQDDGTLVLWASTQAPFGVRREVAQALGRDEESVRVIAPAVGGGFGAKGGAYPEVIVTAAVVWNVPLSQVTVRVQLSEQLACVPVV